MNIRHLITTSALALAGIGLWYQGGHQLQADGRFDFQPNPFGIKRSPYGQVLAMAAQAPVDNDFHAVWTGDGGVSEAQVAAEEALISTGGHPADCTDPACGHSSHPEGELSLISKLTLIAGKRTNPNPTSPAHKFYLRQQIEKKLSFAYHLDPSHFGNYNSYHLFLTEPQLGTTTLPEETVRKNVIALAEQTLRYSLAEQVDPRPSLTAAAAAYNILERMQLAPEGTYTTTEMREHLGRLDFCLARFVALRQRTIDEGIWDNISPLRQAEIDDRASLQMKLRDAAEGTILRLEKPATTTTVKNERP